jgi:hypothetical protein
MAFRDPRELMAAAGGVLPTDPRNERFPMYEIQPRGIGVEALRGIGGAFAAVQGEKVATLQAIREAQAKARAAELEYQREVEKMQKEQGLITDREKLKIASDEKLEQTKQAAENERALAAAAIEGQFRYGDKLPATLGELDPTKYRYVPTSHYSYNTTTGRERSKLTTFQSKTLAGDFIMDDINVKAGLLTRISADTPMGSFSRTQGTNQTATPTHARALTEIEGARQLLSQYSNGPRAQFEPLAQQQAQRFAERAEYWDGIYRAISASKAKPGKAAPNQGSYVDPATGRRVQYGDRSTVTAKTARENLLLDAKKTAQTYRDAAAGFLAWPAQADYALNGDGGQTQTTSESVGVYGSSDDVIPDEMWKK